MFDIGMTELLVIGIVALIVVGPKDLPGMFRTLGRFTGKIKGMAREFQRAMDDAADEAGVKDISRDLKGMSNPKKYGLDKLNEAADSFEKWEPGKSASSKPKGPATQALSDKRKAEADDLRRAAAERADGGLQAEPAAAKDTGTAADTPLTKATESDA
ncbi:twin-arginine translocase subunit TatB [Maribius pontilimi]|uniref:Twin-arginine translocase subunit TatB n=1 Tax=Palleronia pontilimi TaxID=1964209 RepID=A0A934IHP1_9RHOB|nr:Sec-independent protein translocase protein TatB [Palleronia pontilimi]MBJ3762770.1 twin-arginine translocase subunit TatB [Palleronia pontilimi]